MPFIALDKTTNERIDITQIENPRATLKRENIYCQLCHNPMLIKAGLIKHAHFAHVSVCTSDFASHPESPAHREAKIFLATHLKDEFKEYTTATFEYEVPIPQVKRVVDVLVTFPMGWRVAHEVQLAAITVDELYQRSADYELAGMDVVWWLGKSANTPVNRKWCEESFGYALSIYEQE